MRGQAVPVYFQCIVPEVLKSVPDIVTVLVKLMVMCLVEILNRQFNVGFVLQSIFRFFSI